ncbi:holo-ACP synthase [Streptococcus sobrinus]|uniref:holo-ACP synthase n=1 Tax=Streptococcus sobrinus TaxID=1310 RepID=UPI0002EC23D3|nr:holo-ACP synthase [Streptococcus sobrinus]
MIIGHGIDLQEISRVEQAYKRNSAFAKKVLTDLEFERFESLKGQRQMEYLAGRWSAKEAFAKAWGTGIGKLRFHDIEVATNEKGAPIITSKVFSGRSFVSISHSGGFVQASVILEEN